MAEPVKNDEGGSQNHGDSGRSAFSPEYVKELREEAASWRTKFREVEAKVQTLEQTIQVGAIVSNVKNEIEKRGLKINPEFITIGEDGDAAKAVDAFLDEYPQFAVTTEPPRRAQNFDTKPIPSTKTNTNNNPARKGNIMDIKNDPIARAKLRDQYRSMLGRGDN